jgi:penicillin-insensitive murein DD-endopeptidase
MVLRTLAAAALGLILGLPATAEPIAKELFGAQKVASAQRAAPLGGYSRGCVAGAVQLPETGPTWQAMRLSRNRNWGHPDTIEFIQRLSREAARQPGWNGLYIGDISQPRGGPMLTGHASHQIGLDVDIWMLPADNLRLSRAQRESISSISLRRAEGAYVNGSWTRAHHEIIKAAAATATWRGSSSSRAPRCRCAGTRPGTAATCARSDPGMGITTISMSA